MVKKLVFKEFIKNYLEDNSNASEEEAIKAFHRERTLPGRKAYAKYSIEVFIKEVGISSRSAYYSNISKYRPQYENWKKEKKLKDLKDLKLKNE